MREPLAGREPGRLDLDHIDGLLNGFRARVPTPLLDAAGAAYVLEPRSLEELHPDHLLEHVPALHGLFTAWKRRDRVHLLRRPPVERAGDHVSVMGSSRRSAASRTPRKAHR